MKNTIKHQTLGAMSLLLAAAAFAVIALPARAQDASASTAAMNQVAPMDPDNAPWRFSAGIPLWAPQIDGTRTVLGHQENVYVSFNTLREHLDASFGINLAAQKGKFGIFSSIGYMKFSANPSLPAGWSSSLGLKFLIYNGGLSYLLVKTDGDHPFVLVGTAGVRLWYAATSTGITDAHGMAILSNYGNNSTLVDPVIGLRASQYFTPKLHLDVAGDGGGFNVNRSTDWTWSVTGLMTYDFAKWFSLSAGYSALNLDESNGSGNSKNGLNLTFNGVMAVATFKF